MNVRILPGRECSSSRQPAGLHTRRASSATLEQRGEQPRDGLAAFSSPLGPLAPDFLIR